MSLNSANEHINSVNCIKRIDALKSFLAKSRILVDMLTKKDLSTIQTLEHKFYGADEHGRIRTFGTAVTHLNKITAPLTNVKKKYKKQMKARINNLRAFLILMLCTPPVKAVEQEIIDSVGALSMDDPNHILDLEIKLYGINQTNSSIHTYEEAVSRLKSRTN